MPTLSRLPAAVLCSTLLACASTGISWNEGLWVFRVKNAPKIAPPVVQPDLVEVFWLGETPDYPFVVMGRFWLNMSFCPGNEAVHRRIRALAGKRGANVVVFEEFVEGEEDMECQFWGLLGYRPDDGGQEEGGPT